ncbi:MAG: DMT family transporter [Thermoanaerobaculia bacterium]
MAIWGTTFAAIRIGLQGIPPLTGLSLRFLLAGTVLALVGLGRRRGWPRDRSQWALVGVNTLGTFAVPYVLTYWAEQTLPSGLTAVLFSTFPLFVAGLAHLSLAEEGLAGRDAAGMVLGFVGVAVLFSEDLAALGGPVRAGSPSSSSSDRCLRRCQRLDQTVGQGVPPLTLTCLPVLATGLGVGAAALWLERNRPLSLDAVSVRALLYLALAGTVVTFLVYFSLLEACRPRGSP